MSVGGETFHIQSQFSTPRPAWVKGSNRYFDHQREVELRDEAIVVRDTFTNLTHENLPLIQRHRVLMPGLKTVWLAGLSPAGRVGASSDPGNPTGYAVTAQSGVGLIALDDVSQVHVTNFSGEDFLGLADNQCVLKPGAKHTAEWAILPTARPDYWAMLNAVRRLRDVNFKLEGSFAFLRADPRQVIAHWSDRQFADFIRFKDAQFLNDTYEWPSYKGRWPHGTAFQTLDWSYLRGQMARLRTVAPATKHLLYFHCFLDVLDEAPQKYADARLLSTDGAQADYGEFYNRIFVPTTTNGFGRDIAENVDLILDPLPHGFGCEGVYWDEFEYSRYQYHYDDFSRPTGLPWDGVSADIDPRSMKISRLKSSVTLLSQPFRAGAGQADHAAPHFDRQRPAAHADHDQVPFSPLRRDGEHLALRRGDGVYADRPGRSPDGAERSGRLPRDASGVGLRLRLLLVQRPDRDPHASAANALHVPHHAGGTARGIHHRPGADHHQPQRAVRLGRQLPARGARVRRPGARGAQFKAATVVRDGSTFTELRLPEDYSAAIVRRYPAKGTGPCFRPTVYPKNMSAGRKMDQSPAGANP